MPACKLTASLQPTPTRSKSLPAPPATRPSTQQAKAHLVRDPSALHHPLQHRNHQVVGGGLPEAALLGAAQGGSRKRKFQGLRGVGRGGRRAGGRARRGQQKCSGHPKLDARKGLKVPPFLLQALAPGPAPCRQTPRTGSWRCAPPPPRQCHRGAPPTCGARWPGGRRSRPAGRAGCPVGKAMSQWVVLWSEDRLASAWERSAAILGSQPGGRPPLRRVSTGSLAPCCRSPSRPGAGCGAGRRQGAGCGRVAGKRARHCPSVGRAAELGWPIAWLLALG